MILKIQDLKFFLPKMVVTQSMFDTPLELPNIAAPILTSMNSTAMALPIRPLPSIDIPCVESVNPNSMP